MDDSVQVELAIIGGGNMGAALLGGLLDSGAFDASALAVVEVVDARRDQLASQFPGVRVVAEVPRCSGAVIAVKPADTPAAAAAAAGTRGAARVLSIAAGVRLATIEAAAGPGVAVVRAMPNTPALVRLGACAIAAGADADRDDVAWAALDPRSGRHGRRGRRGVAGRVHRRRRLGPRLRLPRRRGADRRPRSPRVSSPTWPHVWCVSSCSVRPPCSTARATPHATARDGHLAERHHRGRSRRARRSRPARRRRRGGTSSDATQSRTRLTRPPTAPSTSTATSPANSDRAHREFHCCFSMCRFSHGLACRMVSAVETRPPETVGSADRAGAIGGLAPALVASGAELHPLRGRFPPWVAATRPSRSSPTTAPPTSSSASCTR